MGVHILSLYTININSQIIRTITAGEMFDNLEELKDLNFIIIYYYISKGKNNL